MVKANSYIPKPDNELGPKYELPNTLTKQSFSLSGRHKELSKFEVPGPGQYPIPSNISANGIIV